MQADLESKLNFRDIQNTLPRITSDLLRFLQLIEVSIIEDRALHSELKSHA